jgi:phosphoenolpyruvate-protein phosphotransferase (PTS system enzyme I)
MTPMMCLAGIPAAPGLARGPVFRLRNVERQVRCHGSPAAERDAIAAAIASAQQELAMLTERAPDDEAAGILALQLELLEDNEIIAPTQQRIESGESAESAWSAVLDALIQDYDTSEDPYFRGRAADLRDLRDRVLDALLGNPVHSIPPGAIVLAEDLAPSRFLETEWGGGGLVLQKAGTTGHVAILARSRGVPMLVGVDLSLIGPCAEALLDADEGSLVLGPDLSSQQTFEKRRSSQAARTRAEAAQVHADACMANGERVHMMINVAQPDELSAIDPTHIDGIGLVRTEFLFHARARLPDEEEQYRVYSTIAKRAAHRPVTIRTLDAGGDKPISGLTRENERNPFLGVRGVRLSLRAPEVLMIQLRALARAAIDGNVKVMVPMVTLPEELAQCRAMLTQAVRDLRAAGTPAMAPALGMMVEVPAAALSIAAFDADFYSIGSNDLLQYLTAASRDEPELSALASPGPAFWRIVREIVEHGRATQRDVSLCGDLASDIRYVPQLLGCGLRTLSVAPASLAAVKAAVRRV